MASSSQICRLKKAEQAIPDDAAEKKIDLSVFSDAELGSLRRYKLGESTEDDIRIIELTVYPKIVAQLNGTVAP